MRAVLNNPIDRGINYIDEKVHPGHKHPAGKIPVAAYQPRSSCSSSSSSNESFDLGQLDRYQSSSSDEAPIDADLLRINRGIPGDDFRGSRLQCQDNYKQDFGKNFKII